MNTFYRYLTVFFVVFLFFVSELGACAVCTDGSGYSEETINAYYFITVLLSLIPVSIGLSIVFIVRRRIKQREKQSEH